MVVQVGFERLAEDVHAGQPLECEEQDVSEQEQLEGCTPLADCACHRSMPA
jgi:hypothetical protein